MAQSTTITVVHTNILALLSVLLLLLLSGSCSAARSSFVVIADDGLPESSSPENMAFRYRGQLFNFFPKGTPIPPSGPSKRHNSVGDSTPN